MRWWKQGPQWRHAWGYDFEWTGEHLTKDQMQPLIYTYDELGTECLDLLDEISPPPPRQAPKEAEPTTSQGQSPASTAQETKQNPNPHHRDYYALLKAHASSDPKLSSLWTQLNTVPPWLDWSQISRGQEVFYRYVGPAIAGLTFQSLLGGFGGYRVVETLSRTGGFGVRVARRRLLETFQHILLVTRDMDSLQPGTGEGWISSVRVRFLHASVKRRILQLSTADGEKKKGRYYDVQAHGVPVNDLDSIGTISAFSSALIWVSLPRLGIFLSRQEKVDFIALWRYVAYLLGTPTEPYFTSVTQAKATMESFMLTEIDPTPTSRVLANNIIAALANQPPGHASEGFLRAETRWLNGRELSDALCVPRPGWWYSLLVAGQCVFFMVMCYVHRAVPAWDKKRIERLRRSVHKVVAGLAGGEAAHDFKYVPDLKVKPTHEAEGGGEDETARFEDNPWKGKAGSVVMPYSPSLGKREVKATVVTGAVVAAVAWLGLRCASGMFQKLRTDGLS